MKKMSKRTQLALEGSIKKWEGIVAGTIDDEGSANCPLCKLYLLGGRENAGCSPTCPVKARTKKDYCDGSPYLIFIDNGEKDEDARAMLDFLKSLRPLTDAG